MIKKYRLSLLLGFLLTIPQISHSQINVAKSKVEEIPTEYSHALLLGSTIYGSFTDVDKRNWNFVTVYERNTFDSILSLKKNQITLSGTWGISGNSVCGRYNYSKQLSPEDLTKKCFNMFLTADGILMANIAGIEFGVSKISKIQNSKFEFDFDNNTGMTFSHLERLKSDLAKTKTAELNSKNTLKKPQVQHSNTSPKLPLETPCELFFGAKIIAKDGTYLGVISDKYNNDSIFNEYGTYGSKYASKSIFNEYGTYGGEYSDQSPFNEYSANPPKLVKGNSQIGQLSINEFLQGSISPYTIIAACNN